MNSSVPVQRFTSLTTGIAGAASVILFIITAALGILVFRMNRDEDEHRKKQERKALVKEYKRQQKLAKNGGLGA